MIVSVPRETFPGEQRVALVPALVPAIIKAGAEVVIEAGAGATAGYPDDQYTEKGAKIVGQRSEVLSAANVILQVRGLGANPEAGRADLSALKAGQIVIGFLEPLSAPDAAHELAQRGVAAFAMELIPRTTRAQGMDALSSQATVAGYKVALLAASALPRMFPMLMTAAGTVVPARVLVVGAGVAGLQAIATCRRLGAVVHAYDIRPAVKEEVQSLGAKFVELGLESEEAGGRGGYAKAMDEAFYQRQRELLARVIAESDVVITTAVVPGRRAPILVTEAMVQGMGPGSVVVDLAAERGGNCEVTRPGETFDYHGITVIGPVNIPSMLPYHASQLYAKNLANFLSLILKQGELKLDLADDIVRETLLTRDGEVVHARVRDLLGLQPIGAPAGA